MKIIPLEIENELAAKTILANIGTSKEGAAILSPKCIHAAFKIEGVTSWGANVIKQHMLSLGSDAAIERAALVKNIVTTAVVFGNISQLQKLCEKLSSQPFGLREVSEKLSSCLCALYKKTLIFRARNKTISVPRPLVCGIINVTPDSFSGDGLLNARFSGRSYETMVLERARDMIRAGARMIDVGAESSRPGAASLSAAEELRRVVPALKIIRKEYKKIILSIDTYKLKVAQAAVDCGIDVINDITALRASPRIASLIKKHHLGCVMMHMKGSPKTMQIHPHYKHVVEDIMDFFGERLAFAQHQGIACEQILLDPGIGFGKTTADNLTIINQLYKFKIFGRPLMLGLSRKSFIGKVLDVDVDKRLAGSLAANTVSLLRGANILRVHDVKETIQVVQIVSAITQQQ
ncbi:MAG: dihydropteroate synthase [Candidatus Omnitrophota bacterium]